jgi:prepilin-type processing-associated H-X9-DG protein
MSKTPQGRFLISLRRWMAVVFGVALLCEVSRLVASIVVCDPGGVIAKRAHCMNNLKQIGMALHNYHDVYGCFPPPFIADAQGRPMHSWRVLILPFLEEQNLYQRYNFAEPWDGPNNRELLGRMPALFACPAHRNPWVANPKPVLTSYFAVTGPGTAFPGDSTVRLADVRDGTNDTVVVVEASNVEIPWTAPCDMGTTSMSFRINDPTLAAPSSRHPGGLNILYADASVRFLHDATSPGRLRAMTTIDGKDVTGRSE